MIHGKAILRDFDRGDLFSQELDRKLTSIVCNVCMSPSRDLESWRTHCVTRHATLPGYTPTLLSTGVSPSPAMFLTSAGKYPCPRCKRRFSSLDAMVDHRHSQMRCVRLVCGQCQGLWADLETHVMAEHGQEDTCNTCGQVGVEDMLDHYHTHHEGFAGVIAETEVKCAGDVKFFSLHFWMNQTISNVFPKLLETRPKGLLDPKMKDDDMRGPLA